MITRRWLMAAMVGFGISGCGRRGELRLPAPAPDPAGDHKDETDKDGNAAQD